MKSLTKHFEWDEDFTRVLILFCVVACLGIAWLVFQEWSSLKVRNSATKIAGADPYCIQVPATRGEGYRQVQSKKDMGAISMTVRHDPSEFVTAHHAVLVVQKDSQVKLFHWSYERSEFVWGTLWSTKIHCAPTPYFLKTINAD